MLFSDFSQYLQKLESISSRLAMTEVLATLFQKLETKEIVTACYLMQGRLVPLYESLEFNLSAKMVIRAIARLESVAWEKQSIGLFDEDFSGKEQTVQQLYKKLGDVGLVGTEILKSNPQVSQLTIADVYQKLVVIAHDGGEGSQDRKVVQLAELLQQLDPISAKFVIRIVIGKLRLGFSTMTLIDSLSWAVTGNKSESAFLEEMYNRKADVGVLAENYLGLQMSAAETRQKTLSEIYHVEAGVPVIPSLCQRLNTSEEIIKKMKKVIAEPKYDGMRIQLHLSNDQGKKEVRLFTRNLENVSAMFPELVEEALKLQCESCILDGEVIGYNPKTGKLLLFQETITRRRKHGVAEQAKSIPIKMFVFDILSKDGQSLIDVPLVERKEILQQLIAGNSVLTATSYIITDDPEKLKTYHHQNLTDGLEGIVSKQVRSVYQSGRKGWTWVKTKETEGTSGKLSDTLDVVVMGYYSGRGKRTEFGLGAILAGVLSSESGEPQVKSIAKIGTGLSDELLAEMHLQLQEIRSLDRPTEYSEVTKNLIPDVWVIPKMVIEVAADEITKSPSHAAGLALRFPRLIRVRTDKSWDQATTLSEVEQIAQNLT